MNSLLRGGAVGGARWPVSRAPHCLCEPRVLVCCRQGLLLPLAPGKCGSNWICLPPHPTLFQSPFPFLITQLTPTKAVSKGNLDFKLHHHQIIEPLWKRFRDKMGTAYLENERPSSQSKYCRTIQILQAVFL